MSTLHVNPQPCARHIRAKPPPWEFAIGTLNVHSLSASSKRDLLVTDCEHYNIDILCIQETKTKDKWEQILQLGHKLVVVEQKEASYQGLGFVINPRFLNSYKYISDWISILDFTLPTRSGPQLKCQVVNAYGPTCKHAAEDNFYAEITSVISIPARWRLFICGVSIPSWESSSRRC